MLTMKLGTLSSVLLSITVLSFITIVYLNFFSSNVVGMRPYSVYPDTNASRNQSTNENTKTHPRTRPLVLGKQLQSVTKYLTDDVLVSVRTTSAFHNSRLSVLLLTWMQSLSIDQLNIVTDGLHNDTWVQMLTNEGYRVTMSNCTPSHSLAPLCCKSGDEYESYYKVMEKYSWFCHIDDDMYLNTKVLAKLLGELNHTQPQYLGYYPHSKPLVLPQYKLAHIKDPKKKEYRYATGATYCISQPLMRSLEPYFRDKSKFRSNCKLYQFPDDMVIGMVIESILGYNLTVVSSIKTHLHMQSLVNIKPDELVNEVSVGYGGKNNRIKLPVEKFSITEDYTGFLSLHCLLYPEVKWCPKPT